MKDGTAKAGIQTANLKNAGIGLAPYHDWESMVPQAVKDKVTEATKGLQDGTIATGYKVPAPAPAASGTVTTTN